MLLDKARIRASLCIGTPCFISDERVKIKGNSLFIIVPGSNNYGSTKRQFIVDEKGRKNAVLLSIREYRELLEDLENLATIAERKNEPAEPFDLVKKRLEVKWQTINNISN